MMLSTSTAAANNGPISRAVKPAMYFLSDPIGNHHIILPGHHQELLENML